MIALLAFWIFGAAVADKAVKLIRFEDTEGVVRYGQPIEGSTNQARGLSGNDPFTSLELHDDKVYLVRKILAPIPMPPAILGIGLNYWGHINATHLTPPKTPSLFFKNRFAYNHPHQPVVVPPSS